MWLAYPDVCAEPYRSAEEDTKTWGHKNFVPSSPKRAPAAAPVQQQPAVTAQPIPPVQPAQPAQRKKLILAPRTIKAGEEPAQATPSSDSQKSGKVRTWTLFGALLWVTNTISFLTFYNTVLSCQDVKLVIRVSYSWTCVFWSPAEQCHHCKYWLTCCLKFAAIIGPKAFVENRMQPTPNEVRLCAFRCGALPILKIMLLSKHCIWQKSLRLVSATGKSFWRCQACGWSSCLEACRREDREREGDTPLLFPFLPPPSLILHDHVDLRTALSFESNKFPYNLEVMSQLSDIPKPNSLSGLGL